jgi:hypothetical protein
MIDSTNILKHPAIGARALTLAERALRLGTLRVLIGSFDL